MIMTHQLGLFNEGMVFLVATVRREGAPVPSTVYTLAAYIYTHVHAPSRQR